MTHNLQSIKKDLLETKPSTVIKCGLKIAEEHYHLRPAGVRVVIENTIDAIMQYLKAEKIDIFVFSDFENLFSLSDLKIKSLRGKGNVRLHNIDIAELNYNDVKFKSKKEFLRAASKLRAKIEQNIPLDKCSKKNPFVFHSHGLPLGKNPLLNAAIWMLADDSFKQKKPIWFLNQVHDFAENSRPEMLQRMQNCTGKYDPKFAGEIMYPNSPNMFYATINSRDAENLELVGIAKSRIFFLPNSIDTEFFMKEPITTKAKTRERLMEKIKKYCDSQHCYFESHRKVLLSPLKVMRRKNNAESVLVLRALNAIDDKFMLMITLEPGSGKDVEYSNSIKKFVRVNRIPVVIGLGEDLLNQGEGRKIKNGRVKEFSLVDIFAVSDAVITTSMLEGFGFCFHEGWLTGKTVLGRKLPYVCKDFERNGMDFDHMYKKMWIKLDWIKNAEKRIISLYYRDVNSLRKKQGIKTIPKKTVQNYVSKIKFSGRGKDKRIDFKDLDLDMQLEAMNTIFSDPLKKEELIAINPVIKKIYNIVTNPPKKLIEHNKKQILKKYSLKAKAKRLGALIKIGNKNYLKKIKQGKISNRKVIAKYLDLDFIHPLTVD